MPNGNPFSTVGFKTEFISKDIKKALAWTRKRVVLNKPAFDQLSFENKLTSWTVAGDLTEKSILSIQKAVNTAIQNGVSYRTFAGSLSKEVLNNITVPRVVWRNAIQQVYQRGRFDQQTRIKKFRPYLEYVTFGDDRVRPNHAVMNGKVAKQDDPFWAMNYPPNGHQCRCVARARSQKDVTRRGLNVQTQKEIEKDVINQQLSAGVPESKVVLPRADLDWRGSFADGQFGALKLTQAFGKFPINTASLVTRNPVSIIPRIPKGGKETVADKVIKNSYEIDVSEYKLIEGQKGSNVGGLYQNAKGEQWYIKQMDVEHAKNEILANKLYSIAGETPIIVPENQLARFADGTVGVASKWNPNLQKNKALFTGGKVKGTIQGYGADAWLANWDVVGLEYDNLLYDTVQKRAVRLDAGGSLKFRAQGTPKGTAFGNTVPELETFLNPSLNPQSTSVFKNYSMAERRASIRQVTQYTNNEDIRKIVNTFGHGNAVQKQALIDKLLARKADMKKQLKTFDKLVEAEKKAKKTATAQAKLEKQLAKEQKLKAKADAKAKREAERAEKAKQKAERQSLLKADKESKKGAEGYSRGERKISKQDEKNISKARQNGYSVPSDAGDIEDQQILFWESKTVGDKLVTNASFKLREGSKSFRNVRGLLKDVREVNTLDLAQLDDDLVTAVRGIGAQANKGGTIRALDLERANKVLTGISKELRYLDNLIEKGVYSKPTLDKYINHYKKWSQALMEATKDGEGSKAVWKIKEYFKPLKLPTPKVPKAEGAQFAFVKKNKLFESEIVNGFQTETKIDVGLNVNYLEAKIKGGRIRVFNDKNQFATYGKVEIQLEGNAQATGTKLYKLMDDLGIQTTSPSALDGEELYLKQILNYQKQYATVREIDAIKDQTERIRLMKTDIEVRHKKLTGKMIQVDKLKDYKPYGRREGFGDGKLIKEIPSELLGKEWNKFRKDYRLYHHFYIRTSDAVDQILNTGGQFAPSADRLRRGIQFRLKNGGKLGMSPDDDIVSGGAEFFYTRIWQRGRANYRGGIVYDADKIRRLDKLSYYGDKFGRTTGTTVQDFNVSDVKGWKKNATNVDHNETDFKGGISIFDADRIVAQNEAERNEILKVFKKHRITKLPDGRKIEDFIRLPEGY